MACANTICNRDSHEVCTRTVMTVANLCTCRIAMLYRCRCDAEPVCARGQVDTQLIWLTLPTISHRGPELLDTHASIFCLWVLFVCTPPSPFVCSGPLSRAIEGGHVRQPSCLDHAWSETEVLAIVEARAGPIWKIDRIPLFTPIFCQEKEP